MLWLPAAALPSRVWTASHPERLALIAPRSSPRSTRRRDSVVGLNTTPALNQLDAFGHELGVLEASGQVSATASHVLKTKHDTVKNSIGNIR